MMGNMRSIQPDLVSSLYAEALVLADEARTWFDRAMNLGPPLPDANGALSNSLGRAPTPDNDVLLDWAGRHDPALRIILSCESLRLTTRLMHIIAWLLLQRAITNAELPASAALDDQNRLGPSPDLDEAALARLPEEARRLILSSVRLYTRVAILDRSVSGEAVPGPPPIAAMMMRLQNAL